MIRTDTHAKDPSVELEVLRHRIVELEDFHSQRQARGETTLRIESEEICRAIFESSDRGLLVLNRKGQVIDTNKRFHQIIGYERKDIIGRTALSLARLLTDKGLSVMWRNPLKRKAEFSAEPAEMDVFKKDGKIITVQINCQTLKAEDRVAGHLIVLKDVTEQKRAERAPGSQSQEVYRSLVSHIGIGVFRTTPGVSGRFLEVNPAMEQITGFSREELLQMDVSDLYVHPEERVEMIKEVLSEMSAKSREVLFKKKDGTQIVVRDKKVAVRGNDSKTLYLEGFLEDITENKRADEEMREIEDALYVSESKYKDFYDNAPVAYYSIDTNGLIKESNKAVCLWLGYSPDELRGMRVIDIYAEESRPKASALLARFQQGNAIENEELAYQKKNGEKLYGLLTLSIVRDKFGQVVASRSVVKDITDFKQTREALRGSLENYQSLFENMKNGYALCKILVDEQNNPIDFLYLEVNEAFEKITGLKKKDVIGKTVTEAIPSIKNSNPEIIAIYGTVAATGNPTAFETYVKPLDMWLDVSVYSSNKDHFVAVFENITERKRSEEALWQFHRKYKSLFEDANDAILIADTETGRIIDANRESARLLGRPKEEIIGMDSSKLHPADKADYYLRQFRNHIKEGRAVEFDSEVVKQDGTVVPVSISANTISIGGKTLLQGIFKDISVLKQAQNKIEQAAAEWRRTFDSITDLVSILDNDFKIVRVNKAYADLFNKTPQELLGKNCCENVHGNNCHVLNCPHQKTLRTGQPATEEFFEPHLGMYLEVATSPIVDDHGKVISSVHVARDITKRKQMEQQLILNGRLASVGELAAGVAHELNNPLTSVIGFSQLLMEKDIPSDIKEDLSLVHSEAERAAGIVKNLLTFARQYPPVKQLTKIENIVEDVLRLRAYEQKINNISIVRHYAPDLPEIMADYSQMEQVFLNIIINAEFAMTEAHKKGTFTITTEKLDTMVRISFADDGNGIPSDNLRQLFNPFFTTKEIGKGTGLGLSICHGIVTEHGGKIYARSQPGLGATFVVELPIKCE